MAFERSSCTRRGFTLVELLIVIGIVVLLVTVLLPLISLVRQEARSATCLSNLRQWGQLFSSYVNSNSGKQPFAPTNDPETHNWWESLSPDKSAAKAILICPQAATELDPVAAAANTSGWPVPGSTTAAWHAFTIEVTGSSRTITGHVIGSYGLNEWLYRHSTALSHHFTFPVSHSDTIPLIGDCCIPASLPSTGDSVPKNIAVQEHPIHPNMSAFCIDRHRRRVNIVFIDGHASTTPLADLWLLRWQSDSQPVRVTLPTP